MVLEWSWLFGIVKGTAFEVYRQVGDGDMLRELPIQAAKGLKEMHAGGWVASAAARNFVYRKSVIE